MHKYKELEVWKKSVDLTERVYALTDNFPDKEKFGLISQIRRCSVSIPSNIAEGAGRDGKKEFAHFLSISIGSLFELETQLIISEKIKYIKIEELNILTEEISTIHRMLFGLKKSLK
jgi:four helix bundle protein